MMLTIAGVSDQEDDLRVDIRSCDVVEGLVDIPQIHGIAIHRDGVGVRHFPRPRIGRSIRLGTRRRSMSAFPQL